MFPCFPEEVKELVEAEDWDTLEDLYAKYTKSPSPSQEQLLSRFTKEEKENYLWYLDVEKIINKENDPSSVLPAPHLARKYLLLGLLKIKAKEYPEIQILIKIIKSKVSKTPKIWQIIESSRYLREEIGKYLKLSKSYSDVEVYRRFKAIDIFMQFSFDGEKCSEQMDIFEDIGYSIEMIEQVFYLIRDECSDLVQYFVLECEWPYTDETKPDMDALKHRFRFMRQHLVTNELHNLYDPFEEFDQLLFP